MGEGLELFTMGSWVTVLAYLTSAIGVFVGGTGARRVRTTSSDRLRSYWMILAALVSGGVGVWLAVFLPMAGFNVDDSVVRYDTVTIVFSILVAMVSVYVALLVAISGDSPATLGRTVMGALVLGAGLAAVPFTVLAAVRIRGSLTFDPVWVVAAVVLAVVTAVGFLAQVKTADTWPKRLLSSALAGAAVIAVHFLAAASVRVKIDPAVVVSGGIEVFSILFPLFVGGLLLLAVPIVLVLQAPDRVAAELEAESERWAAEGPVESVDGRTF
ncbi:signalling protein [Rhodococcus gordoniae]|uniref:Signalling protein n=1 Tax=Rhodococcus gordoniae TaxID=223392 RepID=A0A379M172_9NOCA|nr:MULTISPECIES: MHYT domain-containing protein [Rhodococcus]SUE16060.1 signalling protein [Rhodococcus gordoniae]